jgi:DNA-binding NtrC family response regulator
MEILVVDDEPVVLDSCRRVLEAEGFRVHLVPSADAALAAMSESQFDLLLIDVKMPKRDGMYLLQESKERWPGIPVIVMSGFSTPETVMESARLGAGKFIAKPFTPDELLETIREVLRKERRDERDEDTRHR